MEVSHTELQAFLSCQEFYKKKYLQKIYPRTRPHYFVIGSAVHAFKDVYYKTKQQKLGINAARKVFEEVDRGPLGADDVHKLECDLSMVEGICEAYPKFYSQDFDEYTSFMTEQKLTMPLVEGGKGRDPIRYKGYLDFLAQEAAGDWWVVDTKTTTSPNADYFRKVHIDSQLTGYMWLAKELLGEFPKGVIYDVIKKPSIRLKKGENQRAFRDRVKKEYTLYAEAKGYFVREEIIIGKRQLDRWFRNTQHIAEMIQTKRSIKTKVWPMNTGNCQSGWGSSCQYLEICITGKVNKLQFTKGGD